MSLNYKESNYSEIYVFVWASINFGSNDFSVCSDKFWDMYIACFVEIICLSPNICLNGKLISESYILRC